jgi:hypothetical protein
MRPARAAPGPLALALLALTLAGCGSRLPKGVDADKLDQGVADAIGDLNTCLLIGRKGSGDLVWRFNSHTNCARKLPACDAPQARAANDLLAVTAKDGAPRLLSCYSAADRSRGVGWASGPVPNHPELVYAAAMEGPRALPGRIMADKLEGAFEDAGF